MCYFLVDYSIVCIMLYTFTQHWLHFNFENMQQYLALVGLSHWIVGLRQCGRQFAVLAFLIFLRRLFHRLRRIGRSWQRNVLCALNVGNARPRLELIRARRKCKDWRGPTKAKNQKKYNKHIKQQTARPGPSPGPARPRSGEVQRRQDV